VAILLASTAIGQAQPAPRTLVAPLPEDFHPQVIPAVATGTPAAGSIQQVSGCSTCGTAGGLPEGPGLWGYNKHHGYADGLDSLGLGCAGGSCGSGCGSGGCGENGCIPGRAPCVSCEGQGRFGRLLGAVHNAVCCPDPCYEPAWRCGPNASLFVDPARPVTQSRIRWDSGKNVTTPDRSEFFWAATGNGQKGPSKPERSVDYNELRYYQEAGTGLFSFFVDTPYRNLEGQVNLGAGGFGDMVLGTKSMLLDSELIQTTFQLTTSIPMGAASRGIGVGHVAIEPSLIWAVKLYPDSFWQGQLAYTIPIAGTKGFAGSVLRWNNSWNQVICNPLPDVALLGTFEGVGYTFTSGSFTDPATGVALSANNTTYFSVGPGFRLCVCNKFDFGFGMQFAVSQDHFADQLYRTEIRYRF